MEPTSIGNPAAKYQQIVALRTEDLVPDHDQPRKTFAPDGLSSLAHSFRQTGQVSPLVVRPGPEGKYTIVLGERRWRAAREAGLSHIECVVRHDIDEQKAREMQFAENYQREDIPPLEQARSWKNYLDTYKLSQSELSRRTGIPQRTISHRLALLTLPASLQARVEAGEIGAYEAERIAALPVDQREAVVEAVASGRIGGRILEEVVKIVRATPEKPVEAILNDLGLPQPVAPSPAEDELSSLEAVPAAHDEIKLIEPKKETRKPEEELVAAGIPPQVASVIAIALAWKRNKCGYLKEGVCCLHFHRWSSRGEVPQAAGEPVEVEKPKPHCHVRPTALLCALCPMSPGLQEVDERLTEVELQLWGDPLSGIESDFACDCGATGWIAVKVKCTECGRETWWGWFPKE